ncbi:hypothetical protein THAOC_19859 [Thalassiosira oceanica]|uniref:Uncharacterized protein n=1 Tax=Thalassiosira oceanica TaxID=159749 RepID=K0S3P5_THAOC|nr:hypothetical protein THAOC_19859 [Thalassiosira oceanica]|eukprot:EJK59870.1 hypothetical protein THAOC_19859 [Thalassiosira oceanica]
MNSRVAIVAHGGGSGVGVCWLCGEAWEECDEATAIRQIRHLEWRGWRPVVSVWTVGDSNATSVRVLAHLAATAVAREVEPGILKPPAGKGPQGPKRHLRIHRVGAESNLEYRRTKAQGFVTARGRSVIHIKMGKFRSNKSKSERKRSKREQEQAPYLPSFAAVPKANSNSSW